MGILKLIKRKSKQKAVYWNPTGNDGYGKFTFDSPVEMNIVHKLQYILLIFLLVDGIWMDIFI